MHMCNDLSQSMTPNQTTSTSPRPTPSRQARPHQHQYQHHRAHLAYRPLFRARPPNAHSRVKFFFVTVQISKIDHVEGHFRLLEGPEAKGGRRSRVRALSLSLSLPPPL